jgi:hypothetical protein
MTYNHRQVCFSSVLSVTFDSNYQRECKLLFAFYFVYIILFYNILFELSYIEEKEKDHSLSRKKRKKEKGKERESTEFLSKAPTIVNVKELEQDSYLDYFNKETVIDDISRNFNDYGFGMVLIADLLLQCDLESKSENPLNDNSPSSNNTFNRKSVFRKYLSPEKEYFTNFVQEISKSSKNEEMFRAFK